MLRPSTAGPVADGKTRCDQQCKSNVDVTGFVVGPEREYADGKQEGSERSSLCFDLRHSVEVDQGGK